MTEGVPLEELILKLVVNEFGRRIVITLDFIADNIHFMHQFLGRIGAVENNIRQQIDSTRNMFLENGSIENGVFLIGESIEIATDTLKTIENLQGGTATGALEGDMLAEMSQSLIANLLVTGTDLHADAAINNGRIGRQMDDSQSVGKCMNVIFCHFGCKDTNN